MNVKKMNGSTFVELLNYGYKNLLAHYKAINDLNVFPVPDGDTGTNMKLTYANGLKMISDDDASVSKISDEFARGMLFGARGNSGVLTSQYFRGFADALSNCIEIRVADFARAMVWAYQNAYKACVDVTEGTILTVAREGIEKTSVESGDNFEIFLTKVTQTMRESVDNTPELLPVLKENGVIDSGGKGLLTIFEGFLYFFTGKKIDEAGEDEQLIKKEKEESHESSIDYSLFNEDSELEYGYCTEFLLQLLRSKINIEEFDIDKFIEFMQEHGNSLVCFQTGTIVKVHVHTKKPYEVIEFAQRFGEFVTFKMENMALQHNSVIKEEENKKQERKHLAFIAVAQGDGVIDLFKDIGCDIVLNGGQTMNTSVSEMIDAFKIANADEIILLPNESNMCKAAKQAAELYKDSVVKVIETKTIQEGYYVLQMKACMPEDESLYDSLNDIYSEVISASVFKSGKAANVGNEIAPKGTYVEAIKHDLVGYNSNRIDASIDLLNKIDVLKEKEVLFIIYGQMVDATEVEKLVEVINEKFPFLEVGVIEGKQDVYDLLFGLM